MGEYINKYKSTILKFIDFLIVFFLILLSIKKGGFYKSDYLGFNFIISLIGVMYIPIKSYFLLKNNQIKKDSILFLMFGLALSYSLPIIFNNYTDLSDALFEFTKYYNAVIIYFIVKNSESKNIYINGLILLSIVQGLFGIDQIANRVLSKLLQNFNTGYLSIDLDRMSGTIQYANTYAIIIVIGIILLVEKLDNIISKNKFWTSALLNSMLTFITICLILTKTRFAFIVLLFLVIVLIISKNIVNKKKICFIAILNLITALISSSIISRCMILNIKMYIYVYMALFIAIYTFISYFCIKLINKIDIKINKKIFITLIISTILLISLYFILAFNIYSIVVLDKSNTSYSCDVYLNAKQNNNIKINILSKEKESKYKLKVFSLDRIEGQSILFEEERVVNTSDEIIIDDAYVKLESFKCFKFEFECVSGDISISNVVINDKKHAISYLLIPYDVIERILDGVTGSDSITSRCTYYLDAIKIIKNSPKNLIIGCGGETFKNMYNQFKSSNYTSTEVHNSYLQIFCESGIVGFLFIFLIIVLIIKNYKFDFKKIALYALIIHSALDLNFSYMITVVIFSILIGCLKKRVDENNKNKYYNVLYIIFICIVTVLLCVIIHIEFRANIAYKMYISDTKYDNLDEEEKFKTMIALYKKKFEFDKTDYKNLKGYIDIRLKYAEFLKNVSSADGLYSIKSQIIEINKLLEHMEKSHKYSKDALFYIFDVYYMNTDFFLYTYFENENMVGKNYYKEKMSNILDKLEIFYKSQPNTLKRIEKNRALINY